MILSCTKIVIIDRKANPFTGCSAIYRRAGIIAFFFLKIYRCKILHI